MRTKAGICAALSLALVTYVGCGKKSEKNKDKPKPTAGTPGTNKAPAAKNTPGVDMANKTLTIGALNDESGPAKVIGHPFAAGKKLLAAVVNKGGSGILPDGWKVKLVSKDHAYDSSKAVSAYKGIRGEVLFIGTSFGTPTTLPLRPDLKKDGMVAFPASLSSLMAQDPHTPPLGPSYVIEAKRALDWAIADAKDAKKVKAGIVYQEDDYGKDGLEGWKAQAKAKGVEIVSEQTVSPGQKDMTAVVGALKKAGANYVLLATLPSSTGPVVGTAAQLKYMPKWIGATPAWIDLFFTGKLLPTKILGNFYWVQGLPFWGEKVPGMDKFLAAWKEHGKDLGRPDFYVLVSYVQGLIQLEAFKRALANKDVSRAGYLKALQSITKWDGGGMFNPVNLSKIPYETSTKTRILKPNFETKSWDVVAPYADPQ